MLVMIILCNFFYHLAVNQIKTIFTPENIYFVKFLYISKTNSTLLSLSKCSTLRSHCCVNQNTVLKTWFCIKMHCTEHCFLSIQICSLFHWNKTWPPKNHYFCTVMAAVSMKEASFTSLLLRPFTSCEESVTWTLL